MKANFVMEALVGLMASKALPVSVREEVKEISVKQLYGVQGIVVASNKDETTMVFEDGSSVTLQGTEVFVSDGKVATKHPVVVKTSALKAFVK